MSCECTHCGEWVEHIVSHKCKLPKERDSWSDYFLKMAIQASTRSRDPSTNVGAVITDPKKNVIATGYNDFARGIKHVTNRYVDRELKLRYTIHAELNAIITAARRLENHTLWCTHPPCVKFQCTNAIIQSGISKVVCIKPNKDYLSRWQLEVDLMKSMFQEANVIYLEINKPDTVGKIV